MKHWIIVLDWANNGENGLQIIAVEHSFEAAQQHFQKAVEDERKIADENNWQVYEDDNTTFDAGEDGFHIQSHTTVRIIEV